ncbi:MAG: ornithine cyclodeaminase family protein [Alphaproteobacteria bacterium]
MTSLDFVFLDHDDVVASLPPIEDSIRVVEQGLRAHGLGEVVLPPKSHIRLDDRFGGHFNVLPGYVGPIERAGVKLIGDYVGNLEHGLPTEIAVLLLADPRTGAPQALMDATEITWLRTGCVTAIGARHLARPDSAVLGHVGARGTALSNVLALAALFPLREVRIASRHSATRARLARQVRDRTGITAVAVDSVRDAVVGADIVVEATRLTSPQVLIEDSWLAPGVCLVTYGWVMALDPAIAARFDKLVVDDWEQCRRGGQLYPLIERGELGRERIHAEIGAIVAGHAVGREGPAERNLFWHRGFAVSDIVLGDAVLARAKAAGRGRLLTLWRDSPEPRPEGTA